MNHFTGKWVGIITIKHNTVRKSYNLTVTATVFISTIISTIWKLFRKLKAAESRHKECYKDKLVKAYDTLKLLYFKDYKRQEERPPSPSDMPSFKKMIESLDPPNFSYNSCHSLPCTLFDLLRQLVFMMCTNFIYSTYVLHRIMK